jgi:nitrite reductase/ring-hydroxylating ferredoxin subunit
MPVYSFLRNIILTENGLAMNRRELGRLLAAGGLGFLTGGAALALFGRLRSGPGVPVLLSRQDDIPMGGIRLFPHVDVAVVRSPRGLLMLRARCTHLGCGLRLAGDRFVCPCHGGFFSRDGKVLGGPPVRDLPRLMGGLTDDGTLFVFPAAPAAGDGIVKP